MTTTKPTTLTKNVPEGQEHTIYMRDEMLTQIRFHDFPDHHGGEDRMYVTFNARGTLASRTMSREDSRRLWTALVDCRKGGDAYREAVGVWNQHG